MKYVAEFKHCTGTYIVYSGKTNYLAEIDCVYSKYPTSFEDNKFELSISSGLADKPPSGKGIRLLNSNVGKCE